MGSHQRNLSIGELGQRTGLAHSAIRFYEAKGLVHPTRTAGGQRRYPPSDVRRLSFVLITQRLGFSLAEIQARLDDLPDGREPNRADWERMARGFRAELTERIAGLQTLRDRLSSCIGCGCLSLRACRIYNPGDGAAELGSGPRWLMGDEPGDGEI